MIDLPFAKGKTYAVLGLGKTGFSAGEALAASGACQSLEAVGAPITAPPCG